MTPIVWRLIAIACIVVMNFAPAADAPVLFVGVLVCVLGAQHARGGDAL